jgi:hypothetical protein
VLDGERDQLIPQHRRRQVLPAQLAYTCKRGVQDLYHTSSSKTILAHPCGLGSLRGGTIR